MSHLDLPVAATLCCGAGLLMVTRFTDWSLLVRALIIHPGGGLLWLVLLSAHGWIRLAGARAVE